jgi:hypothetical protein
MFPHNQLRDDHQTGRCRPGPHSGDLASYGIPTIKAAELVVKDINAKGGVSGQAG